MFLHVEGNNSLESWQPSLAAYAIHFMVLPLSVEQSHRVSAVTIEVEGQMHHHLQWWTQVDNFLDGLPLFLVWEQSVVTTVGLLLQWERGTWQVPMVVGLSIQGHWTFLTASVAHQQQGVEQRPSPSSTFTIESYISRCCLGWSTWPSLFISTYQDLCHLAI
jgi:hypothetical protein